MCLAQDNGATVKLLAILTAIRNGGFQLLIGGRVKVSNGST